ncbi:Protein tyrosine/serine phosphatase [Microlunatus sagamiharensis]|uniref:Protein tyrosine/serine phosphatase n=1 Tax=Microlunatus sagamiharensis TaxID=546874 RepID=A0A1H2N9X8_9ACTN|nr:Protein tyrosine/serine phosphatase [Microlunatus sagamiharensis]
MLAAAETVRRPTYDDRVPRWIDMDQLVNLRDVGGTPTTDGGEIVPGRLLRSDNLQDLTPADVDALLQLGVTDVVDLRSDYEVEMEGPGPLSRTDVVHHQHSFFREWREGVGEDKTSESPEAAQAVEERPEAVPDEALPWVDLEPSVEAENRVTSVYLSYLHDRPDSVLAGLRAVADADGAALVHCAAGKDRTGTLVALALTLAGAEREAVVADYAASSERAQQILDRLLASDTYNANLRDRPLSSHLSHPETMRAFLEHVEDAYGGVEPMLARIGWTPEDTARLRAKLRG